MCASSRSRRKNLNEPQDLASCMGMASGLDGHIWERSSMDQAQ